MSHYLVGVIVPREIADRRTFIEKALAPFSESLDVPEYDEKCWCVGKAAERDARKAADAEVGTIESLRVAFGARHPDFTKRDDDETDAAWRTEVLNPYKAAEKRTLDAHPLRDAAAPDCDECHGAGTVRSTSNPNGKWDWWTIGGRWTGALGDYDPTKDRENYDTCWLCRGIGIRADGRFSDMESKQIAADATTPLGPHPRAGQTGWCNGCDGTGLMLKHAPDFVKRDNEACVADLLAMGDDKLPFAILTPDGRWCERGRMGWFAAVSDEQEDWKAQARSVLGDYREHVIVAVDCHV